MLTRIWRTEFDPDRLDDLQRFANQVSAPMFDQLSGCVGYIYATDGSTWITQTFWTSQRELVEAEASELYKQVVARISTEGFLRGEQSTEVMTITAYAPPQSR